LSRTIAGYLRRHHVGLIAIFLVLRGTAVAASQPGSDGDFDACFEKKTGDLDLLKKGKCDRGEKAVSWGAEGPEGPAGPAGQNGADGAPGAPGAPGSAVAYGRVNSDGTLTQAAGVSGVTNPQPGVYCISVPGVNATERSMVASVEYNNSSFQNGITGWSATDNVADDPMPTGGGQFAFAQWDAIPNFCAAGTYEVRTNRLRVDAFANQQHIEASNASFSFVVP
jgi:hypothetical protein